MRNQPHLCVTWAVGLWDAGLAQGVPDVLGNTFKVQEDLMLWGVDFWSLRGSKWRGLNTQVVNLCSRTQKIHTAFLGMS